MFRLKFQTLQTHTRYQLNSENSKIAVVILEKYQSLPSILNPFLTRWMGTRKRCEKRTLLPHAIVFWQMFPCFLDLIVHERVVWNFTSKISTSRNQDRISDVVKVSQLHKWGTRKEDLPKIGWKINRRGCVTSDAGLWKETVSSRHSPLLLDVIYFCWLHYWVGAKQMSPFWIRDKIELEQRTLVVKNRHNQGLLSLPGACNAPFSHLGPCISGVAFQVGIPERTKITFSLGFSWKGISWLSPVPKVFEKRWKPTRNVRKAAGQCSVRGVGLGVSNKRVADDRYWYTLASFDWNLSWVQQQKVSGLLWWNRLDCRQDTWGSPHLHRTLDSAGWSDLIWI